MTKDKTKINIQHIAKLSNLKLSASENKVFERQLSGIVEYIKELSGVNTSDVEPTSQTTGLTNVNRDDIPHSSLTQDQATSGSENKYNGYFVVDMILENKEE